MSILDTERSAGAEVSVVVQFGGQTPLKLALPLQEAGVKIIGTSPDSIDLAEDRERFSALLNELQIPQPQNGMAVSKDEALEVARGIGYPVVVRPSYVLGGRAMAIVYDAGLARALHGQRRRRLARAADPDRPLPRGRLRARRRRARRRRGPRRHRRRDGAHRGGRHPLGRQLVRRPDLPRRRQAPADDPRLHAPHRAGAQGRRPDERAVRHQGRPGLRPRSEPARVAHRAVPVQGERRAAGQDRGPADGGGDAAGARPDRATSRSPACSSRRRCSRSCASRASTRSSGRR